MPGKEQENRVVGAAMIVGGGIAGMQAALDLAESGYRVYLVESKSAIGGHMAQLDKTFPTNDCSMCIISPKLVDTGRHRNIDLLLGSELLSVEGEPGNMIARVRTAPRYIDLDKCTGCGDCAEVCPIVIPSQFDEGLTTQRAAYKLYQQAVPNAFTISKLGVSPCRDACPAGQRAQGYIALIREGRYDDAMRVIKEDNPFPAICGRICNHRCEDVCSRGKVDEALNIHGLKRFVADQIYSQERVPPEPAERLYEERVAVIGAGPCGLTAAQDLCKQGYAVTVFEALPVAGGMLRVGVPEFRLPAEIIDREVQDIVDLGVDLRLNTRVDNLDDLFEQGYSAVLISVGAHEGRLLPIEGVKLDGVLLNTDFLRDVRLGNPPDVAGKRVMVLGGGNVAIDVARSAVRLGADEVHMACLEERETMPAHAWEIEEAEEEGVILHPARSFVRVVDDGSGKVAGLECINVTFMAFEADGRLTLETEPGSEHVIDCDVVVFSIGQRADLSCLPDSCGVGVTRQSTVVADANTLVTGRPGVFAAGDAITGTAFAIEAIASGHQVAGSIHRYLRGEPLEFVEPELPVVELTQAELDERKERGELVEAPCVAMDKAVVEERKRDFREIELGYTVEQAQAEAERCLACGICSECLSCVFKCQAEAVNHEMVEQVRDIEVGAVLLAPGFDPYPAAAAAEYGWGRYPNVVTALQFERLLSASGPTHGHAQRLSDGETPTKIAFIQCVGSRDQEHDYCSSVCCMYATKEAILAIEHERDTQITVFMMDMRSFSKGYEEYYQRAQKRYGIRYVRSRISHVREDPETHNLILRYVESADSRLQIADSSPQSAISNLREEEFDLVVLSIGMEIPQGTRELAERIGVELDENGFCRTSHATPLQTSRPGVYALGPFVEPKDIPESVVEASAAAGLVGTLLAPARWSATETAEYVPERDVMDEEPRIGVFVCHCGSNIGGFVDVPLVAEYASSLPGVIHSERNLYTCSQDTIEHITEVTREQGLNRVVVASCSPLTHEPLFQDAIRQAGLNTSLFEMANIRNQCSWVHPDRWEDATGKSIDLVRMAIAKAARLEPLFKSEVKVEKAALVIGGGPAGMTAALTLADQGFPVHLVEQGGELGGNLLNLRHAIESVRDGEVTWFDPREYARELVERVSGHALIQVYLNTEVMETAGFLGNFESQLDGAAGTHVVRHGVTIVATGGVEYRGSEYGYGSDPRVVTQQEFEDQLDRGEDLPDSVVMIQCVGPAEQYCGRVCCTAALKNALQLKRKKPDAQVVVIYRDVRTFGFKERIYQEARRLGVLFVQYDFDRKPEVRIEDGRLRVSVWDSGLAQTIELAPERLALSVPMAPPPSSRELATRLKLPLDQDGFFLEAHVKLRPVDFSSEGYYMAGVAHYPKFLDEAVTQARAAASRATTVLSRDTLEVGGSVAEVDSIKCAGCGMCVEVCPYGAPALNVEWGVSEVNAVLCKGCGSCAVTCPSKAIRLQHFTPRQIMAQLDAVLVE